MPTIGHYVCKKLHRKIEGLETGMMALFMALLGFFGFKQSLNGEFCGKLDAGPAYVHIDILESGHTVKRMDVAAIKADAFLCVKGCGVCLKPTLLWGGGEGRLFSTGIALGHYTPLFDCFAVTPMLGIAYGRIRTKINLEEYHLFHLTERFRTISPYVGLDLYYNFSDCWRICGCVQYAWSRTKTKIGHFFKDKSRPKGPSYSLMIERDLGPEWSVNIGAAYNVSLTKEKHGLRGAGVTLRLARWF